MALTFTPDQQAAPPPVAPPPAPVRTADAPPPGPPLGIVWRDGVAVDEASGRVVAVRFELELAEPWAPWLAARASAWGDSLADHAAAILRHYWAAHDEWRHRQDGGVAQPAGTPRQP